MKCGVYFAFFMLKGLFNYGETDFAWELMTCNDIHSWQTMLNDGATTCMEAWGVEQKWNTSLCHPWASAPVYMAAAEIFGLKPASPGWNKLSFAPKIPAGEHSLSTVSRELQSQLLDTFVELIWRNQVVIETQAKQFLGAECL